MKNHLLAIIALGGVDASAQNLVPNGSFEQYIGSCQFGVGYPNMYDWVRPDCGQWPGFGHACNNGLGNGSGTPLGGLGFQEPIDGVGYAMLWTLRMNSQFYPDGNPQVYASVDLTTPLVAGQRYCMRFYANLVDSSSYKTTALHALFWYGVPSACNQADSTWDGIAQITFDISDVDTMNWKLLEGSFVANGGEVNLTIGSFLYGSEIISTFLGSHPIHGDIARYWIDDVWVWACEVGMEEHANDRLRLYPNPATDLVRIALNAGEEAGTVSVLDVQGRVVLQQAFRGAQAELDVSGLSNGAYVVQLRTERSVLSAPLQVVR
jgi:hypothetical protein